MNKKILFFTLLFNYLFQVGVLIAQDSLVVQENTLGVCTMDGVIEDSQNGYTGEGYANIDNGIGIGMSWGISATSSGEYTMSWRYALGGGDLANRDAALYINNTLVDTINFVHLGSTTWDVWDYSDSATVQLNTGYNKIHLVSITSKGLANIDYFVVFGTGFSMTECIPSFTFSAKPNNQDYGTIKYSPIQDFYDIGTEIKAIAEANEGYFFHSWSGEESSIKDTFTFEIKENTNLEALFYPDGTQMAEGANGYASIQHDNGTPYLLTGGSLGSTVEANTIEELRSYLTSDEPYIIQVSKHLIGSGEIGVHSNKTLIGTTDAANIQGVMMSVANCRNVIFQNMTFSKVITYDGMEINGGKNIWINRCEFFSDRDHDKDYYDGLLDIKNASNFITVSWTNFHDHYKSILISSGDDSYQDSVQRITFHHNYFHENGSRLPSIRFGKSHIFSNYYQNNDNAIHTRVGACVKVEHNYFRDTDGAIGQSQAYLDMDPNTNIFENSPYSTDIPPCKLDVPYPYDHLIDSAKVLPDLIPDSVRIFVEPDPTGTDKKYQEEYSLEFYPNPCGNNLTLFLTVENQQFIQIEIYTITGQLVHFESCRPLQTGKNTLHIDLQNLKAGSYIVSTTFGDNHLNNLIVKQ
jgi:pectate lyase